MADVFLSYSSKDRAAAERVQAALTAKGIDVFWDQETPPGQDWDTWIRTKLSTCKVAIVLWSRASVKSENVRHEAIVARKAGKLLPGSIDPLEPEDFPMGLYIVQAVNLADWRSDPSKGIARLVAETEAKLGRAPSGASESAAAASARTTGDSKARATTTLVLIAIAVVVAAGAWFMIQQPKSEPTDCSSAAGDGCSATRPPPDILPAQPSAECLDKSTPVNGICDNGNRPIPPAPVLGAGGGGRAEAGGESFADKIVGHWNWTGLACSAGPHVTLEGGQLVFTTPDSRFVHTITQQNSQEALTTVVEPSSDAGTQYRLTPEYFATSEQRSFNLVVEDRATGIRDIWAPCTP